MKQTKAKLSGLNLTSNLPSKLTKNFKPQLLVKWAWLFRLFKNTGLLSSCHSCLIIPKAVNQLNLRCLMYGIQFQSKLNLWNNYVYETHYLSKKKKQREAQKKDSLPFSIRFNCLLGSILGQQKGKKQNMILIIHSAFALYESKTISYLPLYANTI